MAEEPEQKTERSHLQQQTQREEKMEASQVYKLSKPTPIMYLFQQGRTP